MSDQNIFQNQQQTPAATPNSAPPANVQPAQTTDAFADLLASIKNKQGEPKYKDLPTALNALKHSQEFIPQLQRDKEQTLQELQQLRSEVEQLRGVKEVVEKLTQQNQQQQATPAAPVLSEEVVAELVSKTLDAKTKKAAAESNLNTVVSTMQKVFGAEAEKAFYGKAAELGMSAEQVNSLAAQSPVAVFKLLGIEDKVKQVQSAAPPSSSVNTAGLQPQPQTFLSKNTGIALVGATTSDLQAERENSKKLVEELHSKGMTTYDLTDPKQYFKFFN